MTSFEMSIVSIFAKYFKVYFFCIYFFYEFDLCPQSIVAHSLSAQQSYYRSCNFFSQTFLTFFGWQFCLLFSDSLYQLRIELCEWKLISALNFFMCLSLLWGQFVLQLLGMVHNSSLHRLTHGELQSPSPFSVPQKLWYSNIPRIENWSKLTRRFWRFSCVPC